MAATLLLWGALLLYAPTFLQIGLGWDLIAYVPGFLMLVFSFAGAGIELGRLVQSQGLNYWGVSLVFLIPSGVLYELILQDRLSGPIDILARIGVLILTALGGAMFIHGVPYLVSEREAVVRSESPPGPVARTDRRTNWKAVASALVALLSLGDGDGHAGGEVLVETARERVLGRPTISPRDFPTGAAAAHPRTSTPAVARSKATLMHGGHWEAAWPRPIPGIRWTPMSTTTALCATPGTTSRARTGVPEPAVSLGAKSASAGIHNWPRQALTPATAR